jgi:hypothetical protein
MLDRLRKEPAVVIGIIAAAALAVLQSLAGNGVIEPDVVNTIGKAIDPSQGGWALPILVGLITRFFVYAPPSVQTIANAATFEKPGTIVDIGKPPEGPAA